jgi:F-type H+-transporting ATPase subunit c
MNEIAQYAAITSLIVLPTLGVGLGQGYINKKTISGIDEQPAADSALKRAAIISMTFSETAILLAVVMGILLIMDKPTAAYAGFGYLGILFSVAVPGLLVGLISSWPGCAALEATTRQPLVAPKIQQLMLITQTIIQTPSIFGFIVGLLIKNQIPNATTLAEGIRLLASGIAFGLGCVGPIIGLGLFTRKALATTGTNREIFPQLRTFTFVSQALIEAPIVFALVISIILSVVHPGENSLLSAVTYLVATFSIGLTTLHVGINSGNAASRTAQLVGEYPTMFAQLSRMSILTQTFIDTIAIYGTLIALIVLLL